jgi:hypothetical protein
MAPDATSGASSYWRLELDGLDLGITAGKVRSLLACALRDWEDRQNQTL